MPFNMFPGFDCEAQRKVITTTSTLKVYEQIIDLQNTTAITVTLPSVAEAAGRIYSFIFNGTVGQAATLAASDDATWIGETDHETLDAAADAVLLFSDGRRWWQLYEHIA